MDQGVFVTIPVLRQGFWRPSLGGCDLVGLARPLVRLLRLLGWGATPTGLRRPLLPLLALVRLLSPTTPLPAIHDPAGHNVAPQAAGNCHRLRMRRVTLPGSELGNTSVAPIVT